MMLLYLAAVAARWPLLDVAPYGDEPLHYWVARHFQAFPNVSDINGNAWVHPDHILWQRPAFYFGFHAVALGGFEAFRVGHLLVASLLAPAGYGLLRASGTPRAFALFGGAVVATFPVLVTWGALAVMDSTMALLFVGGLWARSAGRHNLAAVLFLLSVWSKESAFFSLAALTAAAAVSDWTRGRLRFAKEVAIPGATAALLAACALALVPLFLAMSQGLQMPGAQAQGYGDRLFDTLFVSPWVLPVLLAGLAWPRTRGLAGIALFTAGFTLAFHLLLHRAVEVWYLVLPVTLCTLALVATVGEGWTRARSASPARQAAAGATALVVLLLFAAIVVAPPSPTKGWATHPFTRMADESLPGMYRFEHEIRDSEREAAFAALGLNGSQTLILVDIDYPQALQVAAGARWVYVDSAWFRELFPLGMDSFAQRVEANGTLLLVRKTDFAFYHAINEAYGECRTFENALYRLYAAADCPGGQALLEEGVRSRAAA